MVCLPPVACGARIVPQAAESSSLPLEHHYICIYTNVNLKILKVGTNNDIPWHSMCLDELRSVVGGSLSFPLLLHVRTQHRHFAFQDPDLSTKPTGVADTGPRKSMKIHENP